MIIGPEKIFQCPRCKQQTGQYSVISSNTFGASFLSDGSVSGPMTFKVSPLVKCPSCSNLFWTSDMKPVRKYPILDERADDIPMAVTPSEKDLSHAIEANLYQSHQQLLYLRMQLWRLGNSKKQNNSEMFNSEDEALKWRQNAEALLRLLHENTVEDRLLMAELHRNLGDFDGCRDLLRTIKDNHYITVVNRLKEECDKLNKCMVQL